MAKFKPGDKRPEGSGMKKGQVTKKTMILMEIFDANDFCPAEAALRILLDKDADLLDKERLDVLMKLMEFKFPKRRAIEHSGTDGVDLFAQLIKDVHAKS